MPYRSSHHSRGRIVAPNGSIFRNSILRAAFCKPSAMSESRSLRPPNKQALAMGWGEVACALSPQHLAKPPLVQRRSLFRTAVFWRSAGGRLTSPTDSNRCIETIQFAAFCRSRSFSGRLRGCSQTLERATDSWADYVRSVRCSWACLASFIQFDLSPSSA